MGSGKLSICGTIDTRIRVNHSIDKNEAKLKAARYCAYQERSQKEVRNKLYDLGLYREEVEEVISELISENFINEERFAKAYAGGKFRIKKWGRTKITQGLKQHDISEYCIKKGLGEITEEDYHTTLSEVINRKSNQVLESNAFVKNNKIAKHVISRGFEPDLVWKILKRSINT